MYRWIGGDPRPEFSVLAIRGVFACVSAIAIALLSYPRAYERCLANAIATDGRRDGWWAGAITRAWLRALAPLLRTPLERGLVAFIAAALTRGHAHRFLVGSYVGCAVLFALPLVPRLVEGGPSASTQYAWFSIPLGLACWLTAALRVAMMLPIDPAANWIFKLTEPVDKARMLSSTVTVMQGAVIAPLAIVFGLGAWIVAGVMLAAMVSSIILITGSALAESMTLTLRSVPATCTYRPGQLRLRLLWPVYLVVWIAIAYVLPTIAVRSMADSSMAALLVATLGVLWFALRTWRLLRATRLRQLIFEEVEAPVTTTLDLTSSRA
jgi:hypothetical protein